MDDNYELKTGVDLAFKLVLMNQRVPVRTVAKILDFKLDYTKKLLGMLERKKMGRMNYKPFGETEVMINNGHAIEEMIGMNRMKVFDWMINCPREERGVMFRVSCQNCEHFKDLDGKILKGKEGYDFRPEHVLCGWAKILENVHYLKFTLN